MVVAVLRATALALGRHVRRRRARPLPREPARGAVDGRAAPRPDRQYLLLGGAEARWLTRRVLDVIHDAQLREHGGVAGVRDDGLLESALARPQQKWAYAEKPDLAVLAAAYMLGLVKNHGYMDGNKRVAFMAAYVFLSLNGYELMLDETEVATTVERAAAGRVRESRLAEWIRANLKRLD